jgi:hypothetical protein
MIIKTNSFSSLQMWSGSWSFSMWSRSLFWSRDWSRSRSWSGSDSWSWSTYKSSHWSNDI